MLPAILEDQISQIPALQLLQNLGYHYLRPEEAVLERKGDLANVLLEGILAKQLRRLNRITFKGRQYEFSERNIQGAIAALRNVPIDGLIHTSEKIYDLLSLGKTLEQTIGKDTRSFTLNYIDWTNPENNLFHAAEEFEVEGAGGRLTCRAGIVLFVNGIPFAVIECGRPNDPAAKDSLNPAIFRQMRNQKNEYIPQLFLYSQLLLGVNNQRARYGTVGTRKEFWSCWREEDTEEVTRAVGRFINKPLSREQKEKLFGGRFAYLRQYFDDLEMEDRPANEQDLMIYCLCRPERLLELARQFVVFDAGEKKIARYYQYFAVKKTLAWIKRMGADRRRMGGVIWHTQGSGKSLALIMMAKAIALDTAIPDPRIVLVTDRVDLAEQIWGTFRSCGREPVQARTGRHLLELLAGKRSSIITAVTDKFETAVRSQGQQNPTNNLFFLIDESHRGQYGEAILKMQKLLPNACYIGFTGTPLKKADKETALRLGGIIDTYTSSRAIRDEVLVPLLYERRKVVGISDIAVDISDHFCKNWQGMPFRAQLIADSKLSALSLKKRLEGFGKVSSEVLISSPDVGEEGEAEIQSFWTGIMERYGSEKEYNRSVINAFKNGERPEIIIVVDKLLSEFEVPRNTVLYLARRLEDHSLLKAIARVNRPYPGKDFGYVIDYCGLAEEAGAAPVASGALSQFDEADLQDVLSDIGEEAAKLPERRAELWALFKVIERDEEKFERLLADKDRREEFAARLLAFSRTMAVAFASAKFTADTPQETLELYRLDLSYFQRLRLNVHRRYAIAIDFGEYEARVEKLTSTFAAAAENPQIGQLVDIFERGRFQAEVDKLPSEAAKADTIAHRTKKTISEKMEEDPALYRRFSKSIDELIQSWRGGRISDAEYLNKAVEIMDSVRGRAGDDLPPELNELAGALYTLVNDVFGRWKDNLPNPDQVSVNAALKIEKIIREKIVVDWISNYDLQNDMKNLIEDYLYSLKQMYDIDLRGNDMDRILDSSIEIAKTCQDFS